MIQNSSDAVVNLYENPSAFDSTGPELVEACGHLGGWNRRLGHEFCGRLFSAFPEMLGHFWLVHCVSSAFLRVLKEADCGESKASIRRFSQPQTEDGREEQREISPEIQREHTDPDRSRKPECRLIAQSCPELSYLSICLLIHP